MRFLTRARTLLRRDDGSSIPEAIVATLVAASMMGAIAGGVIATTSLFNRVTLVAASINETSVTDMRWRSDLHTAVGITPTDEKTVKLTLPISTGCMEELWAYTGTAGLTVTTTTYPTLSGNVCAGTSIGTNSEQLMGTTANASFAYANPAGRAITFTAGVGARAPGTMPAGTQQAAWDSLVVVAATLNATSTKIPGQPRTVHSAQQAVTMLAAGAGAATVTPKSVAAGSTLLGNPLTATVAGTGTAGSTGDGAGAATATLKTPNDTVTDAAGNIYVLDTGNNRIRKIDATTKAISAYAGSGTAGSTDNANLTTATFNQPRGIAIASDGSIYVADTAGNKIRKVTAAGVVTIAGTGSAGTVDNATGTSATFYNPVGIAVGPDGTIYVADSTGQKIRVISPASPYAVTTLAGSGSSGSANGTGTAATFSSPQGIALDPTGTTLYIADANNNQIRQIVIGTKVVTTLAGSTPPGTADGTGAAAAFKTPKDITVAPNGTIYVADTGNNLIRALTPAGVSSTIVGQTTAGAVEGSKATASFNAPSGIRVLADGSLLIADTTNNKLRSVK